MPPSRWALACVALLFAVAGALVFAGRLDAAEHMGVPTMQPAFADLRVLTAATQAVRDGLDPMHANPGDPWGRLFNYPRVWLALAPLGLAPRHTVGLALFVWAIAAAGLVWLALQVDRRLGAWAFALSVFSPAWALALERANTDLLIFGLLAGAAAAFHLRPRLSMVVVAAAAALKLFPIAALGLAAEGGARARRAAELVALAFGAYVLVIRADLARIATNTQHWPPLSHGIALAPQWAIRSLDVAPWIMWSLVVAVVAAVGAGALWLRARIGRPPVVTAAQSAALRIGAGVHVGAFVLGSSFDYRLIFLALATPGLSAWASAPSRYLRWLARAALVASVLNVWSLVWRMPVDWLAGQFAARALEELSSWAGWALMACVCAVAFDFSVGGSAAGSSPSVRPESDLRSVRSPQPRSPA